MRYQFIEDHRQEWPTRLMCRTLEVSTGGYYQWRHRPACPAQERRVALADEIKTIHQEVKARYGSPPIHAELVARGRPCSVNTVAKLMSQAGVAAKTKRKFRCTTDSNHGLPVAENIVDRQFDPPAANQTRPGRPTLPTSPLARGGSTWRLGRTSIRGRSSAGR